MTSNFINVLKESGKANLIVSVAFFASMLTSAYFLFTLPHSLMLKGGLPSLEPAWPVLIPAFIAIAITFSLGIAAINAASKPKKERIVYLEKKADDRTSATQRDEALSSNSADASSFREQMAMVKEGTDILQWGLNSLCQQLQAGQGAIYQTVTAESKSLELKYGFALTVGESSAPRFEWGEGLIGQAAASGKSIYLDELPEGYITVVSGLGSSFPRYLLIVPVRKEREIKGVVEIATFAPINELQRSGIEAMVNLLAEKII